MIKPDERHFAETLLHHGWRPGDTSGKMAYTIIDELGLPPKRAWYLLGKWCAHGWYEFGVSLDRGWLTPEGVRTFTAWRQNELS